MRKIIQIAVIPEGDTVNSEVLALCDDGTLWVTLCKSVPLCWNRMPLIPQDDNNDNTSTPAA